MARTNLVIAPHHDDAEFGVGALMAATPGDSWRVVIVATGNYGRGETKINDTVRHRETEEAMKRLGAEWGYLGFRHTENLGRTWDLADLADKVANAVEIGSITDLYIPWPSFNQDHKATWEACLIALRPIGERAALPLRVFAYEYPGNGWAQELPAFGRRYTPIPELAADVWLEALRGHRSQFETAAGRRPGHVTPEGADALARLRGSECGAPRATCHWLIREIAPCPSRSSST